MAASGKRLYPFYADIAGSPSQAEAFTTPIVIGERGSLAGFTVETGSTQSGGLSDADTSNDSRLVIRSPTQFSGTLTTKTTFNRTSTLVNPDEIDLWIEGFSSQSSTNAIVRLKNWLDGQWRQVGTYSVPVTSDSHFFKRGMPVTGSDPITSIDWDFIRDSDGRIEVQIEHQRAAGGGVSNFDSAFDLVGIIVVGE